MPPPRISRSLNWALALLFSPLAAQAAIRARLTPRQFATSSPADLRALAGLGDLTAQLDWTTPTSHLSQIMIPRVPGSKNLTIVGDYIAGVFDRLGWEKEEDKFEDSTPYGVKPFRNLVFTKDPGAPFRLVVAAHYDSKYFPEPNTFVGATDSAAPCALMLDLAEALDPLLTAAAERRAAAARKQPDVLDALLGEGEGGVAYEPGEGISLQFVFFDGEEAFKVWTGTDSVYGARHLAQKWENMRIVSSHPHYPHLASRRLLPAPSELDRIDHFVLLDLLGNEHPTIRNFFPETKWLFDALYSAEDRLAAEGLLDFEERGAHTASAWETKSRIFTLGQAWGGIADDHIPFMQRGVHILHLISSPFPHVWHTNADDGSALHLPTLGRWNFLLRVWLSEYLNLRPSDSKAQRRDSEESDTRDRPREELVRNGA